MNYFLLFAFAAVILQSTASKKLKCLKVTESTTPGLCKPTTPCNRSWFWNYETCSCQLGCDYIKVDCPQGTKWDIFACDCINACPGVVCAENMVADSETCECVPIDVTDTSPETTLPDCGETACKDGYYLDEFTCQCVPIDSTGSTSGQCPEPHLECKKGFHWTGEPFCECWRFCDYMMECPEGEKWDLDVCGCVIDPDYSSNTPCSNQCENGFILDAETCKCNPDYSTSPSPCPNHRVNCESGFYNDPITCNCVPFPTTAEIKESTETTPSLCPEQKCEDGLFWMGEPFCFCGKFCHYTEKCPEGMKWGTLVCKCIVDSDYVSSSTAGGVVTTTQP